MKNNDIKYQICTKCVMDTSDPDISFNEKGVCNHCTYYEAHVAPGLKASTELVLNSKIQEIKRVGQGKKYDVLMGLSGGADSSYVAYLAKNFGLRILAVHLDNGWNSELAVNNIEKCVEWTNADLYTHVIEWEEFKNLQLAYLKASVIDIEDLTDHAIRAILYQLAEKFNIKYMLSGQNSATESIMPTRYVYMKVDSKNILAINKLFGTKKIKTFPYMSLSKLIYYKFFRKIESVKVLDYFNYDRDKAIESMTKEMGWKDYGGKHFESVFTKFYQSHILPIKFGVDKRRPHFASMINSGQITRQEALGKLEQPLYSEEDLKKDMEYVVTKFDLTQKEFSYIMANPPVPHTDYPNNKKLINFLLSFTSARNYVKKNQEKKMD
jgi:N-acetyl sugar amidotransferase